MNKITAIIGVVAGLVVVGAGGLYYQGQKNLSLKQEQFNELVSKMQGTVPAYIKQSNTLDKGLFKSTGVYTVTDPRIDQTLTVRYTLHHGLGAWLTGDIGVEAKGELQGNMPVQVVVKGPLLTTTGTWFKDGSLNLTSQLADIMVDMAEQNNGTIHILPGRDTLVYNYATSTLDNTFTLPQIDADNLAPTQLGSKVMLKNLKLTRHSVLGSRRDEVGLAVGQIQSAYFNLDNLEAQAKAEWVNKKYNVTTRVAMGKLITPQTGEAGAQAELRYSVTGLAGQPVEYFTKLYQRLQYNSAINAEDRTAIKQNLLQLLQAGVVVSVDKAHISGPFGDVNVAGQVELTPVASIEAISLPAQTHLGLSVESRGQLSPVFAKMRQGMALVPTAPTAGGELFSMRTSYAAGVLTVDGTPLAGHPIGAQIAQQLQMMNLQLQQLRTM